MGAIPASFAADPSVEYLKEQGLLEDYEEEMLEPENLITRGEALAFILKINGPPEPAPGIKQKPFRDISPKHKFFDVVREGKRLGAVTGKDEGKYFRPSAPVTLAEALRMMFKATGTEIDTDVTSLPPGIPENAWFANDLAYAIKRGIILQQHNGAIFPPERVLKRGELALLIYRFLQTRDNISFGFASWYGDGLAKTKIPRGQEYKDRNLTAAHLAYPFGTILRVTNMSNGKYVDVVVNDSGPYVTGRIIDLSRTAFQSLASPGAGIISVKVEPYPY